MPAATPAVTRLRLGRYECGRAQRQSQREQDGSEVKSVQLERLLDQGVALTERRDAMELFRDHAAKHFEVLTGAPGTRAPARRSTIARSPPP